MGENIYAFVKNLQYSKKSNITCEGAQMFGQCEETMIVFDETILIGTVKSLTFNIQYFRILFKQIQQSKTLRKSMNSSLKLK